jgi:hypothetical protein
MGNGEVSLKGHRFSEAVEALSFIACFLSARPEALLYLFVV